ncbi:Uncharacterised protein [Burkholderia pseudomallei]|nr:Uncharacterised protein [Burkholderia pseudomallei]
MPSARRVAVLNTSVSASAGRLLNVTSTKNVSGATSIASYQSVPPVSPRRHESVWPSTKFAANAPPGSSNVSARPTSASVAGSRFVSMPAAKSS